MKGLLRHGDHAVLIGQPGSGKNLLAAHLAYAVAQGRSVFGRRVRQGRVLYLAAEDGYGMQLRTRALRRRWGDAVAFHLVPDGFDLRDPQSSHYAEIERLVRELRPDLIVLDTLARAFPGLRENEAEDMGRVVLVVRGLGAIRDAAFVTIHHVAKENGKTPRGHGSLNADANATIFVEGSELRHASLGKNRSGSTDLSFAFNVIAETLEQDEDGDSVTAPMVTEAEELAIDRMRAREAKLRDKSADLLRELRSLVAEHGKLIAPEPAMPLVRAVSRALLRKRLIANGWFSDDLLRVAPQSEPELLRAGYKPENRELTALKRRGFLVFNRELVWLL